MICVSLSFTFCKNHVIASADPLDITIILIDDLGFMVSMIICHSLFRISNVALHLLSFTHQDIKILGEYNSIFFTHPHAPLLSYVLFLLINPTKQWYISYKGSYICYEN